MHELIIYEMHVRSFTQDPSSKVKHPGTFLGIIEKIPYLKQLGINAIELMPIFEWDECELKNFNPKTGAPLKNVWGYSTINFFAPMNRYASHPGWTAALDEFRTLVKELHKQQIEVILDVVYNHTAEGNEHGPTFSFKGIDNQVYYMLSPQGEYLNFSGTGNTFNCNHPMVAQLIVDSLRYWVDEMHVDGFRFDLASILTRAENGAPLSAPPVIEQILNDPVLSNVKLIAEAWDAGGLYQVGSFPSAGRWMEWNGKYRDAVRKFIKGTDDLSGEFSRVISGSQHIYGHDRTPSHSVNFVTAHDGYSLKDLVSYMEKHNLGNGEENRDGANDNESWNCGAEGATANRKIIQLREQQMRNFHAALLLSIGTPMVLMGDEYGHSRNGNNNVWCQDNELNWFNWDLLQKNQGFHRFFRLMIRFRTQHPLLMRTSYLTDQDVQWHGLQPLKANWGAENRFIAYTLFDHEHSEHLYIAFNATFDPVHITLPQPPSGKKWYRIVDTSHPSPDDFIEQPRALPPMKFTYDLKGYAMILFKALS
jgi:isoamylase/glycogen operon protein